MPLFEKRQGFRPLEYPWAYEAFVTSEQMHWLAREVPLNEDVKDWKVVLTDGERNLLTQIFRFFTQADVDVASGYIENYLPKFQPTELRMMMTSIAAREAVHIQAYSMLIDEVGIPETEYAAFLEYQEMKEKHDFMFQDREGLPGLAEDIAVFSAFGEGLQLFASFVMLLNFTRFGKMKGMGQIVAWSIRDETHHVESMIRVYHQLLQEHPELNTSELGESIRRIAADMVELEDRFIDLAYAQGGIEGLTKEDVKLYIRYIADIRLSQLGLNVIFGISKNPLPWVDIIVFGKEHTNFFENRSTDYSKGAVTGNWDDAFDDEPNYGAQAITTPNDSYEFNPGDPFIEKYTFGTDRPKFTLHSKPGCPYCADAETMLQANRIDYEKVTYDTPEKRQRFKMLGFSTFPQIYHGAVLVGGFDRLETYIKANRLGTDM